MNENKPTGFYDNSNIDKIDREIKNHLARPTLVSDLKKQNEKKNEVKNGLTWGAEWKKYWYVYIFLAISALFTGTLGIYMGLSPSLITEADGLQYIHFNTDVGHVLLAFVYFIAFIGVTEAAFAIAKWKYYTREENNHTQHGTMLAAMGIAGLSILLTGIAGGTVVASNIAFLSDFVNIPSAAQKWVVVAIPVLIVIYTVLFTAYALSSAQAASERITNEMERERELDNKTRMNAIRQIATEKLQAAEIDAFQRLVMQGLLSSAEALAAIEAGRSLKQEELFLGRDLDGDGRVGNARTTRRPQGLGDEPTYPPVGVPTQHKTYTTDDLCKLWAKSREQVYDILATYNNSNHFYSYSEARGNWLPEDMTRENFGAIYHELMTQFRASPDIAERGDNGLNPTPAARPNGQVKRS